MGDTSNRTLGRGAPVALALVAAAAAGLLMSGCAGARQPGGGPPDSASAGSASAGSASAGSTSSGGAGGATTIASTGGGTAGGATAGASGGPAPAGPCATPGSYLTAIRTGRQASADRVVFQFAGKPPSSYTVTQVPQIVGDGSGEPVAIAGTSFLKVTFRDATAVCPATGRPTYLGPSAATPHYAQLRGLAAAGDFEGYLTWGIGLAAKGWYHAFTLTGPYRVVIDISRP